MSDSPRDSLLPLPPPAGTVPLARVSHEAMACTWEAFIPSENPRQAEQAARAAFAEVDRLEQELSRFIPHSDVVRINALSAGRTVRVGIEVLECLELAGRIHQETHGAFDVTIGALLANRQAAQSAPPQAGMDLLDIRRAERTVGVRVAGLKLDLGGIGKGYAVDRAIDVLRKWSIPAALLHSGQSSAYALGAPPGQPGWTIAIRNPTDHSAALGQLSVRDAALGGSGVLLHGRHIIDPRTRQPAAGALGAWALAPSAAAADALSTAFMVLSRDEVAEYCRQHSEISALLYVEPPGGELLKFGPGFDSLATVAPASR
jgi:thiamine biosynthesis lipoprotein